MTKYCDDLDSGHSHIFVEFVGPDKRFSHATVRMHVALCVTVSSTLSVNFGKRQSLACFIPTGADALGSPEEEGAPGQMQGNSTQQPNLGISAKG